jgi:DNA polymerase sigma
MGTILSLKATLEILKFLQNHHKFVCLSDNAYSSSFGPHISQKHKIPLASIPSLK